MDIAAERSHGLGCMELHRRGNDYGIGFDLIEHLFVDEIASINARRLSGGVQSG